MPIKGAEGLLTMVDEVTNNTSGLAILGSVNNGTVSVSGGDGIAGSSYYGWGSPGGAGGYSTSVDPRWFQPATIFSDGTLDSFNEKELSKEQQEKALLVLDDIKKGFAEIDIKDEKSVDKISVHVSKLEKLGLVKAAEKLRTEHSLLWNDMVIASYGYKKLPKGKVDEYAKKLGWDGSASSNVKLEITPLAQYEGTPPAEALTRLEEAQGRKLFDSFAIMWVKRVPDPILVGQIKESKDYYFIAEWGDDVSVDQIMNG